MNKQQQSCGFGSTLSSFYKGTNNIFLTPEIKNCLNIVYGPRDSSYTLKGYAPDIQNSMGYGSSIKSDIKYLRRLKD